MYEENLKVLDSMSPRALKLYQQILAVAYSMSSELTQDNVELAVESLSEEDSVWNDLYNGLPG